MGSPVFSQSTSVDYLQNNLGEGLPTENQVVPTTLPNQDDVINPSSNNQGVIPIEGKLIETLGNGFTRLATADIKIHAKVDQGPVTFLYLSATGNHVIINGKTQGLYIIKGTEAYLFKEGGFPSTPQEKERFTSEFGKEILENLTNQWQKNVVGTDD